MVHGGDVEQVGRGPRLLWGSDVGVHSVQDLGKSPGEMLLGR